MKNHPLHGLVGAVLAVMAVTSACLYHAKPKKTFWTPAAALEKSVPPALTDDQAASSLEAALALSIGKYGQIDSAAYSFGRDSVSADRIRESLADFQAKLGEMGLGEPFFHYVRDNYVFYRATGRPFVFTGYYEPTLRGSLTKSAEYPYPLYRRPDDLVVVDLAAYSFFREYPDLPRSIRGRLTEENRVIPYFSRNEIDFQDKLAGRDLEIVWIDSLIDVFFLQIQGSGIVQLDNGERIRVNYAETNGHPYRSIGKYLIDRGAISRDQGSLQGIRDYLRQHPDEWRSVLDTNPSYVFFRITDLGPIGSFGVPLTAERSIATDRFLFPQGTLAWIETEKPVLDSDKRIIGWEKFGRFVLNQDTGGAIRGPGRADLFFGSGEEAEIGAGHMMQKGSLFFLLKK